jgi:hypothetical protein
MEGIERVIMSLVIPMTTTILHATSLFVHITLYHHTDGELTSEEEKEEMDLCEQYICVNILILRTERFWASLIPP